MSKNSHLIRIAALVNLLFLLLCVALVLFMGFDHSEATRDFRKIAAFAIANMVCWLVNVCIVIFLLPALSMQKQNRNALFYFLSFCSNLFIVQLLSGFVMEKLQLKTSDNHLSPLYYAVFFNAISLLSIELIISRYEKSRMKLENAELKVMSLQAQHEKLKNQFLPGR